jgi:Holliday junction resolvase
MGLVYRQLEQQAMLLSFIDVFRWTALVAFTCAIVGWLFHKVTHREDGSVKVHRGR